MLQYNPRIVQIFISLDVLALNKDQYGYRRQSKVLRRYNANNKEASSRNQL